LCVKKLLKKAYTVAEDSTAKRRKAETFFDLFSGCFVFPRIAHLSFSAFPASDLLDGVDGVGFCRRTALHTVGKMVLHQRTGHYQLFQ
jgi:hypothetical protein